MSKFVDRPRYSCALGGALFTLRALPRVIPIIHASAGCGYNIYNAGNSGAGYLGGGYCGGTGWSSTNVVEQEIVFGGEDRLREQITSTLSLIDGDLFVVVTGCMVEMIGDDAVSVAAEFRDAEAPVLAIPTPGFKGNSYEGYDMILSGLFRSYVRRGLKKRPDTVNIWGLVPGQDAFYKGNLTELRRLLARIGLRVNTFFGEGEGLDRLRNASEASLNIVLSDVYGLKSARVFEEAHGTPYKVLPLPIGAAQTSAFVREAAEDLPVSKRTLRNVILDEEARYYDYLERVADIYNDADLQRYAILAGDLNYVPAVSRFISDELGWLPKLAVITDLLDEDQRSALEKRFAYPESGLCPQVKFDTDTSSLRRFLPEVWEPGGNERYYDGMSPAVLIGSVLERELAEALGLPLFVISFPVTSRVVFQQAYAGYNGGLNLASDLLTTLISGR
jgi:nitrogenase molybdenum-iron protein beta chain